LFVRVKTKDGLYKGFGGIKALPFIEANAVVMPPSMVVEAVS